ncbi:MAG: hypothetical protein H6813_05895 [Phycisphaeraceae bacterium]|nr:hypothetical protein [Phycisphaeraceae bacterium]MCB9848001.1 hypothetical protein [Phycisphaeraceae bacterium]
MTLNLQNMTPAQRRRFIENKVRREACETQGATLILMGYVFVLVILMMFPIACMGLFGFAAGIPGWAIVILAAVLGPILYTRKVLPRQTLRHLRKQGRPFCLNCYYDLKGLEEFDRCPECGSESLWSEWDLDADLRPRHRPR